MTQSGLGSGIKSRVSDQNGISLLYIMLEIHHSGREPSKWNSQNSKLYRVVQTKLGSLITLNWEFDLSESGSWISLILGVGQSGSV